MKCFRHQGIWAIHIAKTHHEWIAIENYAGPEFELNPATEEFFSAEASFRFCVYPLRDHSL